MSPYFLPIVLNCEYTFPGGEPRIKLHMASLAYFMLLYRPNRCILLSATIIRVFVAFSIANFVFPFSPHILPMHLDKWSPCRFFTSFMSKLSRKRSSNLKMATASCKSKPTINALM